MKIHYKTIIVEKEQEKELFGNELYYIIHTGKGHYQDPFLIDYCCEDMKEAVEEEVLYPQEVANAREKLVFKPQGLGFLLQTPSRHEEGSNLWYFHTLKFCPWCGEKVELVEDYKARKKQVTVTIPKKVIPARKERREKEIQI